jgi:hypothetical protein
MLAALKPKDWRPWSARALDDGKSAKTKAATNKVIFIVFISIVSFRKCFATHFSACDPAPTGSISDCLASGLQSIRLSTDHTLRGSRRWLIKKQIDWVS